MVFGMGACSLQCTIQCSTKDAACYLYDQLIVLAPLMLALSACSPIVRGYLVETDVRWFVIADSVDDRTETEREKKLPAKPRFSSADMYLGVQLDSPLNDVHTPCHHPSFLELCSCGVDQELSAHVAHLLSCDPLVIFADRIEIDDSVNDDHFQNFQSTNWKSVRLKPPDTAGQCGWRVEFRPMEMQLTDFENAAYLCFVVFLCNAMLHFRPDFRIPISKVDQNFIRAATRHAITNQRFSFSSGTSMQGTDCCYSAHEIFNGTTDGTFLGLVPLLQNYLQFLGCKEDTTSRVLEYLACISMRASATLPTAADWIRKQVTNHPGYQYDSVVTPQVAQHLLERIVAVSRSDPHTAEDLVHIFDGK
ncbi:glutamate-cysteine ligase [Pelomyxa schiedti]|nr:glutamate-cysteine ligase [Pelomyxa schiedti]